MRSKADEYEKIMDKLFELITLYTENTIRLDDFIDRLFILKDLYEYKKAKKD